MVKFLKTWFRSKRDLENALAVALVKQKETQAKCDMHQINYKRVVAEVTIHREIIDNHQATIASLQRDLAAAHAKILIQEETPPEALHGAGKRVRKKPVHLSYTERDEVLHYWRRGKSIQDIAKVYEVTERTVHRIVKEAQGRDS